MEAQDKRVDGTPAPEVITALLDLARLFHRVEFAASNALDTMAPLLLERLATLCQAPRGGLLLTTQHPRQHPHAVWSSANAGNDAAPARRPPPTEARKTLRTLALHHLPQEQVQALLAGFSSDGPMLQSPAGQPCCLLCRLPISTPLDHQLEEGAGPSLPTAEQAETNLPLWSVEALLVLAWDAVGDERGTPAAGACPAAEQARTLLPWLLDAAGAVLMQGLLVERVHELEALADRTSLREMELLKAELLATVSHELRSPLASIKGYAATLLRHERRISREERHEFLLAITQASDRLAGVIDRLLEMSQLETGDLVMHTSEVNLAYLVREAITALEQRLLAAEVRERPWTVALWLEDGRGMPTVEEPVIWADRQRLREVLDNLLDNAIHYSPHGGAIQVLIRPLFTARRTIMPAAEQAGHEMVEVCVRDQGIGIPPAHLERIFERFHRVDMRLTREVNGIGLGLAICKRIVELHGGVIWAESDVGQGSTFHVWLPRDARIFQ